MANFYDILKNVCTLAHEDMPVSFDDTTDPYPELKQYIKNTVDEVCSKFPWKFREKKYTFNTTSGQREYTIPAGLEVSNIIENGMRIDGYNPPLYFISHNDLDQLILTSGKPYRYSVYSSELILDPTPNDIYSIQIKYLTTNYATTANGLTEKSNLDLETDITIIPERFIKVIEWGAFVLYRQNFKPDNKYNLARNKFMEYLLDMQKQDGYSGDSHAYMEINIGDCDINSRLIKDFFNPGI